MLRLLKDDEIELFEEAWGWVEGAPDWFKATFSAWGETKSEFFESAENEMRFGLFDNGLTAVIRLVPVKEYYCLHLYARKKTNFELLTAAGLGLRDYLTAKGVKGFFGWIAPQNRSVVRLYKLLGFEYLGITKYKGHFKTKPIEWMMMQYEKKSL